MRFTAKLAGKAMIFLRTTQLLFANRVGNNTAPLMARDVSAACIQDMVGHFWLGMEEDGST
jgi:hypothetical protein